MIQFQSNYAVIKQLNETVSQQAVNISFLKENVDTLERTRKALELTLNSTREMSKQSQIQLEQQVGCNCTRVTRTMVDYMPYCCLCACLSIQLYVLSFCPYVHLLFRLRS